MTVYGIEPSIDVLLQVPLGGERVTIEPDLGALFSPKLLTLL